MLKLDYERVFRGLIWLLLILVAISVYLPQTGRGQQSQASSSHNPFEGAAIFRQYCASCHGADARGHGPASAALKHRPPDLTRISQRNKGKFPFERVKKTIEGDDAGPIAHGNRDMPIWGPIFHQIESDQDLGEVRMEAITKYLESLQQK